MSTFHTGGSSMKVHKAKRREMWGGLKVSSLCGRLNNACKDVMNITDTDTEVTCGFCLKALKRIAFDEVGRRNAQAANAAESLADEVSP